MFYALILSITMVSANFADTPAAAMVQVRGFTSQESCLKAANDWLAFVNANKSAGEKYITPRAFCIRTDV